MSHSYLHLGHIFIYIYCFSTGLINQEPAGLSGYCMAEVVVKSDVIL